MTLRFPLAIYVTTRLSLSLPPYLCLALITYLPSTIRSQNTFLLRNERVDLPLLLFPLSRPSYPFVPLSFWTDFPFPLDDACNAARVLVPLSCYLLSIVV